MKTVFVLLSVVAAALAAPQFNIQKPSTAFSAPFFPAQQKSVIIAQKPAAVFTYQKPAQAFAAPAFAAPAAFRKTASVAQYSTAPQQYSQRVASAPVIVNFGLERTHPDQPELIIRQTQTHDADGSYSTDVELEKGIKINEQGFLKNAGTDAESQSAQGSYSFVGDDGQTYTVNWIADENGYQAQGAHLPTPPPFPAELEQAYAIARADPDYKETNEQ